MQLLTTILDWCFPPRPEQKIVRTLRRETLTPIPRTMPDGTVCLLPFHHPDVRALIHEAKFFYNRAAHRLLGAVIHPYLAEHHPTASIVPIPLHPKRERARGFNQVTACITTKRSLRSQLNRTVLYRARYTQPQTKLAPKDRTDNVAEAFAVRSSSARQLPVDRPIVLIDDVYTTGATLQAAYRTLRTALPDHTIYCLTFAYA